MIILAVLVGYILGIAPFIVPKIIERIDNKKKVEAEETEKTEIDEQKEIFNEWVYGTNEPKLVDQHELFEEYITGKVKGA